MNKKPKVIAVLIAYEAAKTLKKFWADLPKSYFDEVILVDDASGDRTFEIAKKLTGLQAYQNRVNVGYGENLKRALAIALEHNAEIIVDIHPDAEYKPSAIPLALEKIRHDGLELVIGNRFASVNQLLRSGIYLWKVPPLIALNFVDRLILGTKITDFHQGFRVYTKNLLKKVNFGANSNNYLFSLELIAQATFYKIKVGEVPVETSYKGKKRGASFKNSIRYSLSTFKLIALFILAKIGFKIKIFQKPAKALRLRIKSLQKELVKH